METLRDQVASGLRLLGIVGALLLLIGPAVAGVGFVNLASLQNTQNQCHTNCSLGFRSVLNATAELGEFEGAGIAIGGLGLGLVLLATVGILTRGPRAPPPTVEQAWR